MYTVLFPSGNTLVFSVKAVAEMYVVAYRGVLIATTDMPIGIDTDPVLV